MNIKERCEKCKQYGERRFDNRCGDCFRQHLKMVLELYPYGAKVAQLASVLAADESLTRFYCNKMRGDNEARYEFDMFFPVKEKSNDVSPEQPTG